MTVVDSDLKTRPRLRGADLIPVLEALNECGGTLAMLSGIDGRFYRAVGAAMAILPDGQLVGQLTGGCIEGDLAIQASQLSDGTPARTLRYGKGSPFIDIKLPCGSGIDVSLLRVATGSFSKHLDALRQRQATVLDLPDLPAIEIMPRTRIALFGDGAEAQHFAPLARTANLEIVAGDTSDLSQADPNTAVLLLYHNHEGEIPLLDKALQSSAFWIGAQGSHTVQARRREALETLGHDDLSRLRGPIGLINNARDPMTLAVSVLAEITEAQP